MSQVHRTVPVALALLARLILFATSAEADTVYLDANFDDKPVNTPLGTGDTDLVGHFYVDDLQVSDTFSPAPARSGTWGEVKALFH